MPSWHIYHPDTIFTEPGAKATLVQDITALYTLDRDNRPNLPPFYVNVFFHPFAPGDMWNGGKPLGATEPRQEQRARPFVLFSIDQIAVKVEGDESEKYWCDRVNEALKPHIEDKGHDWEFYIDNTPRGLWRINGLQPPPWKSEAERKWYTDNVPTPWQ